MRISLKKLSITKARLSDKRFIFNLYNLGVKSKNFKTLKKITFENHSRWYSKILKSNNDQIYVARLNHLKIGYIKFQLIKKNSANISIIINKRQQNLELGSKFLNKSILKLVKNYNVKFLYSEILKKNKVSLNFFRKNGFSIVKNKKKLLKYFDKKNYLLIRKNYEKKIY